MLVLKTLSEWDSNVTSIHDIFSNVSDYLKLGELMTASQLYTYFLDKYESRCFYRKYDTDDTTQLNNNLAVSRAKAYINMYCNSHKYEYDKLYDTLNLDYNPIENYSMTETGNSTRTPNLTTADNTTIDSTSTGTGNAENIEGRTTYDQSANFINANKNTGTTNDTNKTEANNSNTRKETGTDTNEHTLTRKGNIGVTTSQEMIESERKVAEFALIDIFLKSIADLILVGVY